MTGETKHEGNRSRRRISADAKRCVLSTSERIDSKVPSPREKPHLPDTLRTTSAKQGRCLNALAATEVVQFRPVRHGVRWSGGAWFGVETRTGKTFTVTSDGVLGAFAIREVGTPKSRHQQVGMTKSGSRGSTERSQVASRHQPGSDELSHFGRGQSRRVHIKAIPNARGRSLNCPRRLATESGPLQKITLKSAKRVRERNITETCTEKKG